MWGPYGQGPLLSCPDSPCGSQVGCKWYIWALVSPAQTQMGPRSSASWVKMIFPNSPGTDSDCSLEGFIAFSISSVDAPPRWNATICVAWKVLIPSSVSFSMSMLSAVTWISLLVTSSVVVGSRWEDPYGPHMGLICLYLGSVDP